MQSVGEESDASLVAILQLHFDQMSFKCHSLLGSLQSKELHPGQPAPATF